MSDSEPAGTNQHPTGHQSANIQTVARGVATLQSAALADLSTLKTSQVRKDNLDDGLVRKLSLRVHTHTRSPRGGTLVSPEVVFGSSLAPRERD